MTVSGQIRLRGDGLAQGCIAAGLVAKVIKRIASVCAYAMDQFDGKSAGESMEKRPKNQQVREGRHSSAQAAAAGGNQEMRKLSPR